MKKWDEDRDVEDEQADENDPEKPNLEEMKNTEKEKLTERRQKDSDFMEEFGQGMKDKSVFVIDDLKTDCIPQFVFLKIIDKCKNFFAHRNDIIER